MTKRRRVPSTASRTSGARDVSWAGLQPGDPVDVLDPRERGATWRFEAFVTNDAGDSWVEVVGGRRGEARRRSFRPEQVFPVGTVHGSTARTASLDVAPQFPL